jgi:uncharacterized protein YkwD
LSDTDQDGFSDKEEINRGFNPLGSGNMRIDTNFAKRQAGKIFLQVESLGEAWYIYPKDNKRYYLGRPTDAFSLMRALSTGISDSDIKQISSITPVYDVSSLESKIFDLVNQEREKEGLGRLKWNGELAQVARMHSEDLAIENESFTALGRTCDYPIIHHEGKEFGLYNDDRLKNSAINYYSRTGENIALVSSVYYSVSYAPDSSVEAELDNCDNIRHQQEQNFLSALEKAETEEGKISVLELELTQRAEEYLSGTKVEVKDLNWRNEDNIAQDTVKGWMDSPGHRANILNPEYDEAGMGLERVNGYVISSQIFIKRATCGYTGGACCQEEGYYPYCYLPNTCTNDICQ